MARHARSVTNAKSLCLAGGVALNCVANGELFRQRIFDDLWLQPAAGDAGGSLGSALYCWHHHLGNQRYPAPSDSMNGAALGPDFSPEEIQRFLDDNGYPYTRLSSGDWVRRIAAAIAEQKVVGLFQGRMEFGPRALGNRSIIGDPRSETMQSVMNLKIKYRESFRPFAPSVLRERLDEYFDLACDSPYMLLVAPVRSERRRQTKSVHNNDLIEWVNESRSDIPAVTHVDDSARVQTVDADRHPRFHAIIKEFQNLTGCSVVVNTSFNVRGEPIVCTPQDAYLCFMRTEMDVLVLEDFILMKEKQPKMAHDADWKSQYQLD
jgi:carbamoyltransferase